MTSKENGEAQDNELLDCYRRASATGASAPSEAVRAAILAESRRVAAELQEKGAQPTFDASRGAANDSRWKITAFGTLGAALLAALLIAPRFWQTLPASKVTERPAVSDAVAPAPAPALASSPNANPAPPAPSAAPQSAAAPTARSESLQEVVVTQASRKRATAPPQDAAKSMAEPAKDERLADQPAAAPQNQTALAEPGPTPAPTPAPARSVDNYSSRVMAGNASDLARAGALFDKGAAIDQRDAHGRTPLMLAVMQGKLEDIRLLLERGANPNLSDYSGKTPLQQAMDQNQNDIAELLRRAGAH